MKMYRLTKDEEIISRKPYLFKQVEEKWYLTRNRRWTKKVSLAALYTNDELIQEEVRGFSTKFLYKFEKV